MNAYEKLTIARKVTRPTSIQFINALTTDFLEFHGDRTFSDDLAIIGGVAMFCDFPLTVIGIQKGRTTEENIKRNFGQVHPEGYRKALRLMKQAEKFNRPVLTFINTSGAFCGVGAEERGQGEAIARNLFEMSKLSVPIIAVIIGEGGSGGALGLAVADVVIMLSNSVYSILSPEGFASILWKDGTRAKEAAELMKITAQDLLRMNVCDIIIDETEEDGKENNFEVIIQKLKTQLLENFERLKKLPKDDLIEKRYGRFRSFGEFEE